MISQLFDLPLRALIIAAVLPIPPALGAARAGQDRPPAAAMSSAVPDHPIPLSGINTAAR